jgi:hypothetical protein
MRPVRFLCGVLGCSLLAASVTGSARALDLDWVLSDRGEGDTLVYEAAVDGSSYMAYRVEATLETSAASAFGAAVRNLVTPTRAPKNQRRTLLQNDGEVFVVHTRIAVPFVSDRDVVVRIESSKPQGGGEATLTWRTVSHPAAPPERGVVRLTKSRGSWTFTPLAPARTRVIYENHSDVGGRVPAWLASSMLRGEAVGQISELRQSLLDYSSRVGEIDVAGTPREDTSAKTP